MYLNMCRNTVNGIGNDKERRGVLIDVEEEEEGKGDTEDEEMRVSIPRKYCKGLESTDIRIIITSKEDTRILTTLNLILKYETSKEKHIYLIFLFFCTSDNKSYMDNTNVRPSTRS
ncbi:hypothetical protein V1477_021053, partial [Vespula maculifrons]